MATVTLADAVRDLVNRFPHPLNAEAVQAIGNGLQRLATDYGVRAVLTEAANWLEPSQVARPAVARDPLLDQPVTDIRMRPGQGKNIRY